MLTAPAADEPPPLDESHYLPMVARFPSLQTDMVYVPAGNFQMGCDPAHNGEVPCLADELPLHTVTLDAYWIDRYEVSNERYAQCVANELCAPPAHNSSLNRVSYYNNTVYADYPVLNVDWHQADAFCRWLGKRLPAEAEWEKAARGAADTRAYPWGDAAPDCTRANFYNVAGGCTWDTSMRGVFPFGASPYGALDMAGNVWEWVADWYGSDYYSTSPIVNPLGPDSGTARVTRGGGWTDQADRIRVATRYAYAATDFGFGIGFRCALTDTDAAPSARSLAR